MIRAIHVILTDEPPEPDFRGFCKGLRARGTRAENPYRPGTANYDGWEQGYRQADND